MFDVKKYSREYYLANRENLLKKSKEYQAKNKTARQAYLAKNRDKFREYDREWYKKNRERAIKNQADYNKRPEQKIKVSARKKLQKAVYRGKIKRLKCHCGKESDAHHTDYSKPLEVIWLCRQHHTELHKKLKYELSQH